MKPVYKVYPYKLVHHLTKGMGLQGKEKEEQKEADYKEQKHEICLLTKYPVLHFIYWTDMG